MNKSSTADGYPYLFVAFYASIFMTYSIFNTFLPLYFKQEGYSGSSLGVLLSIGPLIAIISQPIWGTAGDRAKSKNFILRLILGGSGVTIFLFLFSSHFYYLVIATAVFSSFYYSLMPISDTITLEYLENTRWKFGPIRLAGTAGFAVMSVAAGAIASKNIKAVFFVFFIVSLLAFLITCKLPEIKGHQHSKEKISIFSLFKYKDFMLMSIFYLIIMSSMSFYYSFFGIYYEDMGAGRTLVGISMFISATSEVPFLLYASKLFKKIKSKYIMLGSAATICLRWYLLHIIGNIYAVLPTMLFHGLSFIILSYAMATYVNKNMPKALKASGQAVNWLIALGLSRITGSIIGGIFVDAYGIRQVFFYNSIFVGIFILIFGVVFLIPDKKNSRKQIS